jgi:hypothetical protein
MKLKHFTLSLVTITLLLSACQKEEQAEIGSDSNVTATPEGRLTRTYDANVPHSWFNLSLKLIKSDTKFTPPVASRALGLTSFTLYESVIKGSIRYRSISASVNGPQIPQTLPLLHDWRLVANKSMHTILTNLFVYTGGLNANAPLWIDSVYNANKNALITGVPQVIVNRSENFGTAVATAIYNWSATDPIGHQAQLRNTDPNYVVPAVAGAWVATPPAFALPVQPYWGQARTFSAGNATAIVMPTNPIPFSTTVGTSFYNAAYEVYQTKNNITPEQNTIALYWADGGGTFTPPGHMIAITKQILEAEGANLEKAALVYCKVGMAIADAFVACWRAKYVHTLQRPITYIKANIDPNWNSLFGTPPFPAYTSGHSTQSAAAATVLTDLYGYNYGFTDQSKVADGFAARTFSSFYNAADEAAVSRLYGGIHYRMDNEAGYECGRAVANNINALPFARF